MAMFDVVGIGYSAMDYLGIVPRYPELDEKLQMLEFSKQGGGPAATAMATVGRLGGRASYVGKVGDDDFGRFMLTELEKDGVNIDRVVVQHGAPSQFAFIVVDGETGKRTIFWTRSGIDPLLAEELDRDHILSARVLLVDGHDAAAAIAAASWANEVGIPVVYDAGSVRDGSEELAARTDFLAASCLFARQLTGEEDAERAGRLMLGGKSKLAAVTLGEEGCVYATSEGTFRQPAFEVDVVDTTGAGDVFHGALSYAVSHGWPYAEIIEFCSAVAALKCTKLGGRAGIPSLPRTLDFLRARSENRFWVDVSA